MDDGDVYMILGLVLLTAVAGALQARRLREHDDMLGRHEADIRYLMDNTAVSRESEST